jgi:hypothetical protein
MALLLRPFCSQEVSDRNGSVAPMHGQSITFTLGNSRITLGKAPCTRQRTATISLKVRALSQLIPSRMRSLTNIRFLLGCYAQRHIFGSAMTQIARSACR